jgi:hypothetical protein
MASLFFDLARRRPQIEVEAKIYGGCALAFAVAMLPKALGAPADVSQNFYSTMAEWSDIAYVSIVALPFVSREALAFNGIGATLGMLAIVAVLDPFIQQMCDLFDFIAVTVLGLSVAAADHGKNPKAARCLTIATACYATVQLDLPGKGTPWFFALISAASLTCSLCLLVVMYGRTDRVPYAGMARHQ